MAGDEDEQGEDENTPKVFLDDASDIAKIARKVRKRRIAEDNAGVFWKSVFENPVGRQEMWAILMDCQAFKLVVGFSANGATSTEATLYKIGQQQLGLKLYHKWLSAFPQLVYLMHAENDDRFVLAGSKQSKAIVTNGRPGSEPESQ